MERIEITNITNTGSRIEIRYSISSNLQEYFNPENIFWIEYSENISDIPQSISVIPFVCNVLPIIWLTNSILILPEIDEAFFENISRIKDGYKKMHPKLQFQGKIQALSVIRNEYITDGGNAAFFSGGIDALTTLVCHRNEFPSLITLKGADIKLDDTEGWNNVYHNTQQITEQFNLPSPIYVSCNFRTFLFEGKLGNIVRESDDGWWHGFQHGIGILGQAAPISYKKHFKTIYIASSSTEETKILLATIPNANNFSCASDPTIDNHVKFGSTNIIHDQYEKNRQQKIQTIVNYCKKNKHEITARVCWVSRGGKNCCECEKCIRTMFSLFAENVSPKDYGFDFNNLQIEHSRDIVLNTLKTSPISLKADWLYITNRFRETGAYKNDYRINWIYRLQPLQATVSLTYTEQIFKKLKRGQYVVLRIINSLRNIINLYLHKK